MTATYNKRPYRNIRNVKVYLDSKDFAHNLITYPDGKPATMDIDAVHMNKFRDIIMLEQKEDLGGFIHISHFQRDVYERLAQADFVRVYLVGTHDYTSLDDMDDVFYCEINDLGNPVDFEKGMSGIQIKMENNMICVPKYQFSKHIQADRVFTGLDFKN